MSNKDLWREAQAANREYLDGKINLSDLLGIIHDLSEQQNEE